MSTTSHTPECPCDDCHDRRLDEASHAAFAPFADVLAALGQDARFALLVRINDALTPILRDALPQQPPTPAAWVHPFDRPSQKLREFVAENKITSPLALAIIRSMAEVDADITHVDEPFGDDQDRPPMGDDYNSLWDQILGEIAHDAMGEAAPFVTPPDAEIVAPLTPAEADDLRWRTTPAKS